MMKKPSKSGKSKSNTKRKTSNPLYVVTNKGRDVEMAKNRLMAIIGNWNREKLMAFYQYLWESLISSLAKIGGYTGLLTLQKLLVKWTQDLKVLTDNTLSLMGFFYKGAAKEG